MSNALTDKWQQFTKWCDRHTTWHKLGLFGNTPLAKAVLFTPFVAIVVINAHDIVKILGFNSGVKLYWSLIFLSAGQAIYSWRAPRYIKVHGADKDEFIQTSLNTWTGNEFNQITSISLRNDLQTRSEDILFTSKKGASHIANVRLNACEFENQRAGENLVRILKNALNGVPVAPQSSVVQVMISQADKDAIFNTLLGEIVPLDQQAELYSVFTIHDASKDNERRRLVLKKFYEIEDSSRSFSRILAGLFFLVGSIYFIWNAVKSLWKVGQIPF